MTRDSRHILTEGTQVFWVITIYELSGRQSKSRVRIGIQLHFCFAVRFEHGQRIHTVSASTLLYTIRRQLRVLDAESLFIYLHVDQFALFALMIEGIGYYLEHRRALLNEFKDIVHEYYVDPDADEDSTHELLYIC